MNDLRFALRQLLKNPGFTAVAGLTLAVGVGASTAVFSLINGVLLRPVMCKQPEELVGIYQHDDQPEPRFHMFSYPDFAALRERQDTVFRELFAFTRTSIALQQDTARRVPACLVSANYLPALGVAPAMGRVFQPAEETSGAPVAILTHPFWKSLGADPEIVGKTLPLARSTLTVIGVMPEGFTGAQVESTSLFLPLGLPESLIVGGENVASRSFTDPNQRNLMLMGRLKPGLDRAHAAVPLAVLNHQLPFANPADPTPRKLVCTEPSRFNFSDRPDRKDRGLGSLAALAFGLSVVVLAVACLNLANMLLARNTARRKEIALRLALGARRWQVLRQLLTEGAVLAGLGGVAGLLISALATRALRTLVYAGQGMPIDFPLFDFGLDWRVALTCTGLIGFATGCFALGPAWKLARMEFQPDLKQQTGTEDPRPWLGRFGVRDLLAVTQLAFALALLVTAALFGRSAFNAYTANPGFEFGSNFYLALDPDLTGSTLPQAQAQRRKASEVLSALPGVASVSAAVNVPFGNRQTGCSVQLAGAPPPTPEAPSLREGKAVSVIANTVGAGYFTTMGIPLRRGREFETREDEAGAHPPVAIISQDLADELWPHQEAIGRSLQIPGRDPAKALKPLTVVGVVPAIQWRLFRQDRSKQIYFPIGQDLPKAITLHVRLAPGVDPAPIMAAARAALQQIDPGFPIADLRTLTAMHRDGPHMRVMRLGAVLFGGFGGVALLLGAVGIYGLRAYSVARRTREIGIRMALGASSVQVVGMFLREGAWVSAAGLVLGVLLAAAAGRLAASYLYEVQPLDPTTFALVPVFLLLVSLISGWLPARRAARVDPMEALRTE